MHYYPNPCSKRVLHEKWGMTSFIDLVDCKRCLKKNTQPAVEAYRPCPVCGDHIGADGACWLCDKPPSADLENREKMLTARAAEYQDWLSRINDPGLVAIRGTIYTPYGWRRAL